MTYILPKDFGGYREGTELREITLTEARTMECNRCGACCNGLADNVNKDEETGLPLSQWGTEYPDDLYEGRYGQRLLQPIVMGDGGPVIGEQFDRDVDGLPYTSFTCSMFSYDKEGLGTCALWESPDPSDLSTIRPRACGEFPVFGLVVDDVVIAGRGFVPAVGSFPECTWYGVRVVGPYRQTEFWRDRWERQQKGEMVADLSLPTEWTQALIDRARSGQSAVEIVSEV